MVSLMEDVMLHIAFDGTGVTPIESRGSPKFRLEGTLLFDQAGTAVAEMGAETWLVQGRFFTGWHCPRPVTVHFEVGGGIQSKGTHLGVMAVDGQLRSEQALLAKLNGDLWFTADTDERLDAIVLSANASLRE
jgi:hypothetical protein